MHIDLTGKTAIITGSTEEIGLAIAKGLADAGASVVINGRIAAKVDAAVARLSNKARGVAADLGTAEGHATLADAVPGCRHRCQQPRHLPACGLRRTL